MRFIFVFPYFITLAVARSLLYSLSQVVMSLPCTTNISLLATSHSSSSQSLAWYYMYYIQQSKICLRQHRPDMHLFRMFSVEDAAADTAS